MLEMSEAIRGVFDHRDLLGVVTGRETKVTYDLLPFVIVSAGR